jgi:hypothetical protein
VSTPDQPSRSRAAELGARLRFALSMVETGVELTRCRLRREHPEADDARIQELLNEWLLARPADEFSDRPDLVLRRLDRSA